MALVVKDRVMETTSSTGTGTITLGGSVAGYQSFSVVGDGNTTYYAIDGGSEWEVGIGTYTASGTTLSRDTVLESSNSGSLVNFSSGTKNVFVTYPAEKSVDIDSAQTLTNKTISGSSNTLSNIGNSSLTNSSITINGTPISLGGSVTVGSGDVTGAASSTDNAIARYDGTTGKIIQNSSVTITDNGAIAFNGSTNYGTSGQILRSNGDAPPTWINQASITAGSATSAQTLQGGNAGTIVYQSANSTTAFLAAGTTGQILQSNGASAPSWTTLTAGDVTGAASSTDNAIARFDGTTGKIIQNSSVTIDDTTGTMTFTGSGARITGDFNVTSTNNVFFQNNIAGNNTFVTAIPNGTAEAGFNAYSNSTLASPSFLRFSINPSTQFSTIESGINGAGTYYPLRFVLNGTERLRITNNGGVSFGTGGTNYGIINQVLISQGDAPPIWTNQASLSVNSSTTAGVAFDLAFGAAGQIPYQIGNSNTGFTAAGTSGQVLKSNGTSAPSWGMSGATLLGTLNTTSGSTQTLSGLNLTDYKTLIIYLNNVSSSSTATIRLNSIAITQATGATGNSVWGVCFVDLSIGTFAAISSATASATGTLSNTGVTNNGNCGITDASTSLVFSPSAGSFDAGTIKVYGVA